MNKIKLTKKQLVREAKDYFFILIGLFLYAFGWTGFFLPSELTTGGLTGLSSIIYFATGIPVSLSYLAINGVLLLISIKMFGFKFSLRTIINVLIITALLSFLQSVIKEPIVKGETFMNAILGSVMCGTGLGLVFTYNGSTGGTDIIAMIINKFKPNVSIGRALLLCDIMIISSSYLVFQSLEKVVYGLVCMAVISYTVDLLLDGSKRSVQFFIFSNKYEEISKAINEQVHRGCTILDGTGSYTQQPVKIILVMVKKTEAITIFRLLKDIDPNAFITQGVVKGVYGQGFESIRS